MYNKQLFCKKPVLKNLAIFTGKHLCWSHFLIKMLAFSPVTLLKETPTEVFSCEYCKKFKNTCFEKHLRAAVWMFSYMINNVTSNIWSEEDIFSKSKQKITFQIQLDEKNLPFHDALDSFVFLNFSNACQAAFALHNKRR